MLPVCNGVMVASGGVGKSTVTIYEAICLALGRDVYKRKVLRAGTTLFVTGEDERKDYEYRLYWLMTTLKLTDIERKIVTASIFFEDVSDQIVRLAELNASGNIVMTSHVEELCRLYAGEGLAMVNIDPLVYFGPGERLVNDAEAAMCQVAKRISHELNAHARLIHHTGKIVARNANTDQYAGRGGSSLADGSRQLMQIADKLGEGVYYSPSSLEDACTSVGLSKQRIKQLVTEALQTGELIKVGLPIELRKGSYTEYLAPGAAKKRTPTWTLRPFLVIPRWRSREGIMGVFFKATPPLSTTPLTPPYSSGELTD